MAIYAYCRVSTKKQSMERQVRNIKDLYPDAEFYKDVFTGDKSSEKRPYWSRLLKRVKEGDTIVFDSVSRMSRNVEDGVATYFDLYNKGVNLIFLKERTIDTDAYRNAYQMQIRRSGDKVADIFIEATEKALKVLAEEQIRRAFEQSQKELLDLRERTKEGLVTARNNGKKIGRRTGLKMETRKSIEAKRMIRKYAIEFGGEHTDVEVMKLSGVSQAAYYKYKKELKAVDGRLEKQMELSDD